MTVDIARGNGNAIAVLGGANEALAKLADWVQAAGHAQELVAQLIDTPFVPDAYRPRVEPRATPQQQAAARQTAIATGTAAVLQGITLGLDPLTSLQQIYLVHGRPGMYTEVKVALVKSKGHEVWTEDISDNRAVVCGRRAGTDYVERVTVTMDQARKAGWTSNQAYTKTPQDMLYARAAGRVCDRVAPDVLMGIASVEEIQDEIKVSAQAGTRTVSPRKRAAPAIEAVEEPPLKETPPAEPEPEAPRLITAPQSKKMFAMLRDAGLAAKDETLSFIRNLIDRDLESTKELTFDEARQVIAALEEEAEAGSNDGEDAEPTLDIEP